MEKNTDDELLGYINEERLSVIQRTNFQLLSFVSALCVSIIAIVWYAQSESSTISRILSSSNMENIAALGSDYKEFKAKVKLAVNEIEEFRFLYNKFKAIPIGNINEREFINITKINNSANKKVFNITMQQKLTKEIKTLNEISNEDEFTLYVRPSILNYSNVINEPLFVKLPTESVRKIYANKESVSFRNGSGVPVTATEFEALLANDNLKEELIGYMKESIPKFLTNYQQSNDKLADFKVNMKEIERELVFHVSMERSGAIGLAYEAIRRLFVLTLLLTLSYWLMRQINNTIDYQKTSLEHLMNVHLHSVNPNLSVQVEKSSSVVKNEIILSKRDIFNIIKMGKNNK